MDKMKKKLSLVTLLIIGLMLCFYPQTTNAQGTIFYPTRDSYTNSDNPSTNYGALTVLQVMTGTSNSYIFLYFDLSSLSGKIITNATLKFTVSAVSGIITLTAYAVDATWIENGITWTNQPGNYLTPACSVSSTEIKINVSSIVAVWAFGSISNYGFVIKGTSGPGYLYYQSRENVNAPKLYVECQETGQGIVGFEFIFAFLSLIALIMIYRTKLSKL